MKGRKATTLTTEQRARDKFLAALKALPHVTRAAEATNFSRDWFYTERERNPDFHAAWDAALEQGVDFLEDEAVRRGALGVEEPVVANGRVAKADDGSVLMVRKFSDTLLIASLKRRRAAWRDRSTVDANVSADVKHSADAIFTDFARGLDQLAAGIAGGAAPAAGVAADGEAEPGNAAG